VASRQITSLATQKRGGPAYIAGYEGSPANAAISIVDCEGQTEISTPTFGTTIGAGFGDCVFADSADKLVIENWSGSGSFPFWYYDPKAGLSASSLTIGGAAGNEIYYVDELGVVILLVGANVYIINPITDQVVKNLGNLNPNGTDAGIPYGVCYNSCSGLLYIRSTHLVASTGFTNSIHPTIIVTQTL